jgi:peptide/nickel transport system ATP-binding protein
VTSAAAGTALSEGDSRSERPGAAALTVEGLKSYYRTRHFGVIRDVRAVDDVSFEVKHNEIYGLAGESSSGKTTLIKTIAGLVRPPLEVVAGSISFGFLPGYAGLHLAPPREVARIRWRNLSYIMQGSMSVLNPVRRIRESFRDFAFGHMGLRRHAFEAEVEAHLGRVKLEPSVLSAYPHELSGGMRQRVAIALATICRPEFIIADEPTTALDVSVQAQIIAVLKKLTRIHAAAVMLITHDMGVIAEMADQVAVMYAGRIVEIGAIADVARRPLHPYAVGLMAAIPTLEARAGRLTQIPGAMPRLSAIPRGCAFNPRCPRVFGRCEVERPPLITVGYRGAACWLYDAEGALAAATAEKSR